MCRLLTLYASVAYTCQPIYLQYLLLLTSVIGEVDRVDDIHVVA